MEEEGVRAASSSMEALEARMEKLEKKSLNTRRKAEHEVGDRLQDQ